MLVLTETLLSGYNFFIKHVKKVSYKWVKKQLCQYANSDLCDPRSLALTHFTVFHCAPFMSEKEY